DLAAGHDVANLGPKSSYLVEQLRIGDIHRLNEGYSCARTVPSFVAMTHEDESLQFVPQRRFLEGLLQDRAGVQHRDREGFGGNPLTNNDLPFHTFELVISSIRHRSVYVLGLGDAIECLPDPTLVDLAFSLD